MMMMEMAMVQAQEDRYVSSSCCTRRSVSQELLNWSTFIALIANHQRRRRSGLEFRTLMRQRI